MLNSQFFKFNLILLIFRLTAVILPRIRIVIINRYCYLIFKIKV